MSATEPPGGPGTHPRAAADEDNKAVLRVADWLTPETAAGIAVLIAFWSAIIAWPRAWDVSASPGWRWLAGLAALVLFGVVFAGAFVLKNQLRYVTPFATVGGFGLALIAVGSGNLGLADDASRFGIAVGGTALGGLLLGIVRYGTIRAAASVAAVILVIGVLTFPGAKDVVGESNVGTVVGWMAVLIGANGVAEAALQIAGRKSVGDLDAE